MFGRTEKLGVYLCGIVELRQCCEDSVADFKALIEQGANINFKNPYDDDSTPLHIAIKKQDDEWVRFLIEAGSDPNILNRNGKSAEELAANTKHSKLEPLFSPLKKINENYLLAIDYIETFKRKNLEVTEDKRILKVRNCICFNNLNCLMSSKVFQDLIATSQIFVCIFELDDFDHDDVVLELLAKTFKSLIIIQFYTKNKSFLYFSDLNGNFKNVTINDNIKSNASNSLDFIEDNFDFQIICNLLNSSVERYGQFSDDFMDIELNLHKRIRNWSLADWAVFKADLLGLRFLNLFGLKFTHEINNEIVKKAIQYGDLEDLKLTLGFPNFNCLLESNFLLLAVQSNKLEIVRFLIENNCNINAANDFDESVTDCALIHENYDILLALLQADSPFPENFIACIDPKFTEIVKSRDVFHQSIRDNKIDEIKKFIESNPKLKHVYNTKNQML